MAVKSHELDNPERGGASLETRARRPAAEDTRVLAAPAADEGLRRRLQAAKVTTPKDPFPHCGDCFARGWKAAVREIEGG